jgi:hypothetical protein
MHLGLKSRVGVAACALVAAAAVVPAGASASFTAPYTTPCSGDPAYGAGASFQKLAQFGWGADILASSSTAPVNVLTLGTDPTFGNSTTGFGNETLGAKSCPGGVGPSGSQTSDAIKYSPMGSGNGKKQFGSNGAARDNSTDYIAFDEPPSATELANIQTVGTSATTSFETMPVAQGAVAVDVHLPDGCQVSSRVVRLETVEGIFWGDKTTFGDLFGNSISADGTGPTTADCKATAVRRVVRFDNSGTTFAFKLVLNKANPRWSNGAGGDGTDYTANTGGANTDWPNDTGATKVCRGGSPDCANNTTGAANATNLVTTMGNNAGTVGYADVGTSRSGVSGHSFGLSSGGLSTDREIWLTLDEPARQVIDPALNASEAATSAQKGANCPTNEAYAQQDGSAIPATTKDTVWDRVTGAKSFYNAKEYAFCALTYLGAYDKYSQITGGSGQAQARTVYDYVHFVLDSAGGQKIVKMNDYAALPSAAKTIASAGSNRVSW